MGFLRTMKPASGVSRTADMVTTAKTLVAFYKADQEEGHTTFERYLKTADWHPNPQVEMLMALGVGIGPKWAQALIAKFGTVWRVLNSSPSALALTEGTGAKPRSFGRATAVQLLRRVGRTDV